MGFINGIKNMLGFNNSGYSYGGASRSKKSLKGYLAKSKSPFEDIEKNLFILRSRSRTLYQNAPMARGAIKRVRTNVIGGGLIPKPSPDAEFLGVSPEDADIWIKNVKREFSLWAETKNADYRGLNDFYELQQQAFQSQLMNGDAFELLMFDKEETNIYKTKILGVEADRISTPNTWLNSASLGMKKVKFDDGTFNYLINGVEVNEKGKIKAYHICNVHPLSKTFFSKKKWQRIEKNKNILHLIETEREGQLRGVPFLASVIEHLVQITRYTEAELTAAVVTSFLTAFIKTNPESSDGTGISNTFEKEESVATSENEYELGAGTINYLETGESIEVVDPKRPSSGFGGFVDAMSKQIGSALEIPAELLLLEFSSSYSASRAALLEAWKAFTMRRKWFVNDFCQPVYEAWLSEAVATNRIKAPGFFLDPAIKKAYCNVQWIGPSKGHIDPVKEAKASQMKISSGLSTREIEASELNGTDFNANANALKKESKTMKEINDFLEGDSTNE